MLLSTEPFVSDDDASYVLKVTGLTDLAGNPVKTGGTSFTIPSSGADTTVPIPLAPVASERVYAAQATLSWTEKLQAGAYTVEVAFDTDDNNDLADFAQRALPSSPWVVPEGTSSLTIDLPDAVSYVWRVRADTTTPGLYGVERFEAMNDKVHVYCPEGATCIDDPTRAGNKSRPFRHISTAIAFAQASGLGAVAVAARGGAAAYEDSIVVKSGVSLFGGYDPAFVTRESPTFVTSGSSAPGTIIARSVASTTVVDGFTLSANETCINLIGCSEALTVSHIEIPACQVPIRVSASNSAPGSGPLLSYVNAHQSGTAPFAALVVENAALTLDTSLIAVDIGPGSSRYDAITVSNGSLNGMALEVSIHTSVGGTDLYGIYATDSHLFFDGATIDVSHPDADEQYGISSYNSTVEIRNSTITVGTATGDNTMALHVNNGQGLTIVSSSLTAQAGHRAHAVEAAMGGNTVDISQSTFAATATPPYEAYAVYLASATGTVVDSSMSAGGGVTNTALYLGAGTYAVNHNILSATDGSNALFGVRIGEGSATLDGNRITTGTGGVFDNAGLRFEPYPCDTCAFIARNNVIVAGTSSGSDVFGLRLEIRNGEAVPAPIITNNTIAAGATVSPYRSIALAISGSANRPRIANNILYTTGGTYQVCLLEGPSANPRSLQNNLFFSCPTAFYVGGGTGGAACAFNATFRCYTMESDLDDEASTTGTGAGNLADGNRTVIDYDASGLDDTQHPTVDSPDVLTKQGLNASQPLCGSSGTESCGEVTKDAAKKDRDCPPPGTDCFSRGAYEYP